MADQSPYQEFHTHMMAGFEQMLRMAEHMVQAVPAMGGAGHLVQNAKKSFEAAKAAAEAAWHQMPAAAAEPAGMDAGVPVAPQPDHTAEPAPKPKRKR